MVRSLPPGVAWSMRESPFRKRREGRIVVSTLSMLSTPPSSIEVGAAQTQSSAPSWLPRAVPAIARDTWSGLALLSCVGVVLFAIRLTGAPNLLENEFRLGACVLDVLQHGNWLCPHDVLGNTDRPPMPTWLTALASWPLGRVTRFTLYLPTAAATLLTAWIVAVAGRRRFGGRAGIFGGLAFLLSHVAASQMATARWDGLFALTVTAAALAAFRAWMLGGGWTLFWLAAAGATLSQGPLAVPIGGVGLVRRGAPDGPPQAARGFARDRHRAFPPRHWGLVPARVPPGRPASRPEHVRRRVRWTHDPAPPRPSVRQAAR